MGLCHEDFVLLTKTGKIFHKMSEDILHAQSKTIMKIMDLCMVGEKSYADYIIVLLYNALL